MGNCLSCCVGGGGTCNLWRRTPHREVTLLLLGLDGAGKSTVLANLIGEETEDVTPTIGFANASITLGNSHVTLYDVGGGPRIRGIWKKYYAQSHCIIFVVDASSTSRLDEAKQILSSVLQEEQVVGKPLLIFANKQDQDGALSEEEVKTRLDLDTLLGEQQENGRVFGCTGLSSASEGSSSSGSIATGVRWVVGEVRGRWGEVGERVRSDRARQREQQEREREERRERVRRIREERERLAALQRAEDGDQPQSQEEGEEEEERGMAANPFKPISQVVAEATEREAKAKKEKMATAPKKQQRLREKKREQGGEEGERGEGGERGEREEGPGESIGASGLPQHQTRESRSGGPARHFLRHSVSDSSDDIQLPPPKRCREPSPPPPPTQHGEVSPPWRRAGVRSSPVDSHTHSHREGLVGSGPVKGSPSHLSRSVSSGLSDSTDSLTQVTVPSKNGSLLSESLGPPLTTPTTQSVTTATNQQQTGAVDRSHSAAVPTRSKLSFLARLRGRNKIAPSSQPPSSQPPSSQPLSSQPPSSQPPSSQPPSSQPPSSQPPSSQPPSSQPPSSQPLSSQPPSSQPPSSQPPSSQPLSSQPPSSQPPSSQPPSSQPPSSQPPSSQPLSSQPLSSQPPSSQPPSSQPPSSQPPSSQPPSSQPPSSQPPSSQPLTATTSADHTPTQQSGGDTKRDAEGEKTMLVEGKLDPLQGLPVLPKNSHTLPPLRVNGRPPGLQEHTFTTAEDVSISPADLLTAPPLIA